MSDMVEMVARIIAEELGDNLDAAFANKGGINSRGGDPFRDVNMPYRSDYIDAATAALQALRNPTPEMVEAGLCKWHADSANTLEEEVFGIWQAMIHAALPGTERRGG